MKYDVAIIGAGPGGYNAAFKAADNGLSVVLFEQDKVGGTCLNRGCIPTKSLLHSAAQYELVAGQVPGWIMNWQAAAERKNQTVTSLRQGIEKMIKTKKITYVNSHARIVETHQIEADGQRYEAENIIIATGSKVSIPPIPVSSGSQVITSDELLQDDDYGFQSLTIIGGGVIGVECAGIFLSCGKTVRIIEMAEHLLPNMEADIAQRLNMFFRKKGCEIICSASVRKIEGNTVTYSDKNGTEHEVTSDKIMMATGRKARIDDLADEKVGLQLGRGVKADECGRTNIPNIFVIGDAREGNVQLAHVAQSQGLNVIDLILGNKPQIDLNVIPNCIYTDPEIATVGLSQKQAEEAGMKVTVKKVLTGANGKSVIEEAPSGFVRVVLDEQDVIVGAQLVCPHATELISEMSVLVQKKMKLTDLAQVMHPHPTVAEMISDLCR